MLTMFVLAIIESMSGLIIAASMDTYAQPNTNMSMTGNIEPGIEPEAEPGYELRMEPGAEPGTGPGVEPCK